MDCSGQFRPTACAISWNSTLCESRSAAELQARQKDSNVKGRETDLVSTVPQPRTDLGYLDDAPVVDVVELLAGRFES